MFTSILWEHACAFHVVLCGIILV